MSDYVVFTREQADLIQEWINRARNAPVPSPLGDEGDSEYTSPEVYIIKTPSAGIPAISTAGTGSGTAGDAAAGDTPGSADCDVYYVDSSGVLTDAGFTITVYNLTIANVKGGLITTAKRDKWGSWICAAQPLIVLRGKTLASVAPGATADVYVYEGPFGSETATGRIIPTVHNESSCTVAANQMASIIEMPDNSEWQFFVNRTT